MALTKFTDIAKQKWWLEVTFNVRLLEWLDLAGEDVFHVEVHMVVLLDEGPYEAESK